MNIKDLIKHPEGRRLEFKGELPEKCRFGKDHCSFCKRCGRRALYWHKQQSS